MPSGIGGYIQFPAGRRDVRRWTLGKDADIQDATDTSSTGYKLKEATLLDSSGSFEVLWKTGQVLESDLSVDVGDLLSVVFHIGSTGLGYTGTVLIKHVETVNDGTGPLLMQSCTWEGTGPMVGPTVVAP
jgi:hypothetical protein